ncbi:eukaryotic initiation factor [Musa troglodytarum]|uniref:Eukaryotic initiation factor n=1 Tax=Musa troglodytarum TaxID=320322 RepID=A0A9E7JMM2_9LILI|nr:eukaryotic initiation factor [Musa troglodytarum]
MSSLVFSNDVEIKKRANPRPSLSLSLSLPSSAGIALSICCGCRLLQVQPGSGIPQGSGSMLLAAAGSREGERQDSAIGPARSLRSIIVGVFGFTDIQKHGQNPVRFAHHRGRAGGRHDRDMYINQAVGSYVKGCDLPPPGQIWGFASTDHLVFLVPADPDLKVTYAPVSCL